LRRSIFAPWLKPKVYDRIGIRRDRGRRDGRGESGRGIVAIAEIEVGFD
jgi:hypothetical protein